MAPLVDQAGAVNGRRARALRQAQQHPDPMVTCYGPHRTAVRHRSSALCPYCIESRFAPTPPTTDLERPLWPDVAVALVAGLILAVVAYLWLTT